MQPLLLSIILLISTTHQVTSKLFTRCELARELKNVHELPDHQIATWVCIAKHESRYNTSAINRGSGDHGLFQISQLFWCSPPGVGFGCNAACEQFRDDDLADDVKCIRRIYNEYKRIDGDGFNAWVVYPTYCKGDVSQYVDGCFVDGTTERVPTTTEKVPDEDDDGYDFPPLPSLAPPKFSSKYRQETSTTKKVVDDVYQFPPLPSFGTTLKPFSSSTIGLKVLPTIRPGTILTVIRPTINRIIPSLTAFSKATSTTKRTDYSQSSVKPLGGFSSQPQIFSTLGAKSTSINYTLSRTKHGFRLVQA